MSLTIEFFGAVLAPAAGNAILWADGPNPLVAGDPESIEAAIAEGATSADLESSEGELLGLRLFCETADEAAAMRDRYGPPTMTLVNGAATVLVYLLNEPVPADDARAPTFRRLGNNAPMDVPLPGVNGWGYPSEDDAAAVRNDRIQLFTFGELATKFSRPIPAPVEPPAPAPIETAEPEKAPAIPSRDTAELERLNDARLHGEFPEGVLEQPLCIAFAKSEESKSWPNTNMPFGNLVTMLSKHPVGAKNGPSFITGETIDKTRIKTTIRGMSLMGIDVDCGVSIERVIARIEELGLAGVVYTTHSHLKTTTTISQTKFTNWARKRRIEPEPTDALLRDYVAEVRSYTPEIAASCRFVEQRHTGKGMEIVIEHAPMPKFRVIFCLKTPFVFAEQKTSHQEAIKRWGRLICGMSRELGVPIDESCLDPSRLFYMPRHAEGATFETHILAGTLLDLTRVQEAEKGEEADADPFAQAGADSGAAEGQEGRYTRGGTDMWRWGKEYAEGFEIAEVFRAECPDRIRREEGGKLTVECPFDGEHSNPGDPEDPACFISNASDNPQQTGFVFNCRHNSCVHRKKNEMLCEAINLGWISEEALTNPDNLCLQVEIRQEEEAATMTEEEKVLQKAEETLQDIRTKVEEMSKDTSPRKVGQIIDLMVSCEPTEVQIESILQKIKETTGTSVLALRKQVKAAAKKHNKKKVQENVRELPKDEFTPDNRLKLSVPEMGFSYCLARAKQRLIEVNAEDPKLFRSGSRLVKLVAHPALGLVETRPCVPDTLREVLGRSTMWIEESKDGELKETHPSEQVARILMQDDEAAFPVLNGITNSPFFDGEGNLISIPGYHGASGYYYMPPAGFVMPDVPEHPTAAQALESRRFLEEELMADFPFDDAKEANDDIQGMSSKTHALALLLQPFMRPMIPGPTPIFLVTKPTAGTGAGLLIESILTIQTGNRGEALTEVRSEDDKKKQITTRLMSGATYFWLDNINTSLDSGGMASAVTSSIWSDRQLGSNNDVRIKVMVTWIVSGNNPTCSDEIARRCVPILLDAKQDPMKRKAFKHKRLLEWVEKNRPELVKHCLTIIRRWVSTGRKEFSGDAIASFEAWTAILGGILEEIGLGESFLKNLHVVRENAATGKAEWEGFIQAWFQRRGFKAGRVGNQEEGRDPESDGDASLVYIMDSNGFELGAKGNDTPTRMKSLTQLLQKRNNNVFTIDQGDVKLKIEKAVGQKATYRLAKMDGTKEIAG